MPAYMNNLDGRRHAEIYGSGAFFDLDRVGRQAAMLLGIPLGTRCLVATYSDEDRTVVTIATYELKAEDVRESETPGERCRVFFGELLSTVRVPKDEASRAPEYAPFFNRNGHFRRGSARFV